MKIFGVVPRELIGGMCWVTNIGGIRASNYLQQINHIIFRPCFTPWATYLAWVGISVKKRSFHLNKNS